MFLSYVTSFEQNRRLVDITLQMKKLVIKILKLLSLLLLLLVVVFTVAILWPMPKLEPPAKQSRIVIKSANIIDVKSGGILIDRDILIENNTIKHIDTTGKFRLEEFDLTIDGENKYVIPGLWDMHTHSNVHSEWLHHPLYIANGVTNIRDMSGALNERDAYWVGSKTRLQWNTDLAKNKRVAPRYVLQSSYQIDGEASVPKGAPDFFKLNNRKDVGKFLSFYRDENTDFIKIYQQIKPDSYRELAKQASKYKIHLAGHKPIFITLEEAIKLGQRSFEHGRIFMYECFPYADSLRLSPNWKQNFSRYKSSMVQNFDFDQAKQLMELMKQNNAHWTPTLQTLKFEANAHDENFLDNPHLEYVSTIRKKLWWSFDISNNKEKNLSNKDEFVSRSFYEIVRKQIGLANSLGASIMVGTDVTDSYVFAGFSVHQELRDLVACGLSPIEALKAATIVPARYANLDNELGTVEKGKLADLVILNDNPLHAIENTEEIFGVLHEGVYYSRGALDEYKDYTASMASSFHMNIKVLKSFLSSKLLRVQFND